MSIGLLRVTRIPFSRFFKKIPDLAHPISIYINLYGGGQWGCDPRVPNAVSDIPQRYLVHWTPMLYKTLRRGKELAVCVVRLCSYNYDCHGVSLHLPFSTAANTAYHVNCVYFLINKWILCTENKILKLKWKGKKCWYVFFLDWFGWTYSSVLITKTSLT